MKFEISYWQIKNILVALNDLSVQIIGKDNLFILLDDNEIVIFALKPIEGQKVIDWTIESCKRGYWKYDVSHSELDIFCHNNERTRTSEWSWNRSVSLHIELW